jgi:hypothetical protein
MRVLWEQVGKDIQLEEGGAFFQQAFHTIYVEPEFELLFHIYAAQLQNNNWRGKITMVRSQDKLEAISPAIVQPITAVDARLAVATWAQTQVDAYLNLFVSDTGP